MKRKRLTVILVIIGVLLVVYAGLSVAARHRHNTAMARLEHRIEQIHAEIPMAVANGYDPDAAARWLALRDKIDTQLFSEQWAQIAYRARETPYDQWTEEDWQNITAYVDANSGLFDEMRAIAYEQAPLLDGPLLPQTWYNAVSLTLNKQAAAREVARQLYIESAVRLRQKRFDEAAQSIAAAFRLADRPCDDPCKIAHSVRLAVLQMVLGFPSPDEDDWSRDQTMLIVEAASAAREHNTVPLAYAGEAYYGLAMMQSVIASAPEAPFWDNELEWLSEWAFYLAYANPVAKPWRDYDEGTYAILMERLIALSSQPYYQAAPALEAWYGDTDGFFWLSVLTRFVLPFHGLQLEITARTNAELDLFRLGLLLDLYKAEHGKFPEDLAPLAQDLGGSIPVDPLTGTPYSYTPHDGHYLLSRPTTAPDAATAY